jgi:hypothetical protein
VTTFLIGGKVGIVQNILKERGSDEPGNDYMLEESEVMKSFSIILLSSIFYTGVAYKHCYLSLQFH